MVTMDHDYSKRHPPLPGMCTLTHVDDSVLKYIFKSMNLKQRTKCERVCWKWGTIIPPLNRRNEFYPSKLDTCYIPPRFEPPTKFKLSDVYLSLFKKSPSFSRFTSEYLDRETITSLKLNVDKMEAFCKTVATSRPDISELVIETRVSGQFEPQRGLPIMMARSIMVNLFQKNTNNISSFIVYTEDWSHLNTCLAELLAQYETKLTSLTIIFTSTYSDDYRSDHMTSCWSLLQPTLKKLRLIWNESPKNFGFESILTNLQELTFKPSSDQMMTALYNMKNLTRLSIVGDIKLLRLLTEDEHVGLNLREIIWADIDKKSDEDYRIFYDRNLFNNPSNDRKAEGKMILDHFFIRFGSKLKLLHITVHQLNILGHDFLTNLDMCRNNLNDLKLDFHRRCDIDLARVVDGFSNLKRFELGFRNPIDHIGLSDILKTCSKLRKIKLGLLYVPKTEEEPEEVPVHEDNEPEELEMDSSESENEIDMDDEESDAEPEVIQIDDSDNEGETLSKEDQIKTHAVNAVCEYGRRHPRRPILAQLIAQFPIKNKYRPVFPKQIIIEEAGVTDCRVRIDLLNPPEAD